MKTLFIASLLAMLSFWAVAEDNCAMCHDKPPIPDGHMPVAETSVETCMMCHAADGEDPMFRKIHSVHTEMGLECDSCHGDANEERQVRLDSLLKSP